MAIEKKLQISIGQELVDVTEYSATDDGYNFKARFRGVDVWAINLERMKQALRGVLDQEVTNPDSGVDYLKKLPELKVTAIPAEREVNLQCRLDMR